MIIIQNSYAFLSSDKQIRGVPGYSIGLKNLYVVVFRSTRLTSTKLAPPSEKNQIKNKKKILLHWVWQNKDPPCWNAVHKRWAKLGHILQPLDQRLWYICNASILVKIFRVRRSTINNDLFVKRCVIKLSGLKHFILVYVFEDKKIVYKLN